jgi:molybdopterin-binding protein
VTVEADPESFVIARERFESSARNVFAVRLEGIRPLTSGRVVLLARWEGLAVRAALTPGSVRRLKLTRGQSAFFYLKAVAVRKV